MEEVRHTTYHHLKLFICISLIINMKKTNEENLINNILIVTFILFAL